MDHSTPYVEDDQVESTEIDHDAEAGQDNLGFA